MDRSAQLAELLRRSEPLGLRLSLLLPQTTGRTEQQRQSLLQVLSVCITFRSLVSLELHFTSNDGPQWPTSLLQASAPRLRDLCLAINKDASGSDTVIVPDRPLNDSHLTSLALHFIHPEGLGRGPGIAIPGCFTQLTRLSLYTNLDRASLGQAISQVFVSCRRLTDLTLLWVAYNVSERFRQWWASPPASSTLKRLRVILPHGKNDLTNIIQVMRRNLPHLSVCVYHTAWDQCRTEHVFFCEDAQTVRFTAIFGDPVLPPCFRGVSHPPPPGVPSYAHVTFHNETRSGETFYLRTVDGSISTAEGSILEKSRLMATRPIERLTGLVSVTVAEVFWDALARSTGTMPFLRNLVILVASRQPGVYFVLEHPPQGVQPILFGKRMTLPDGSTTGPMMASQYNAHKRAPYRCTCPALKTLRLAEDPHFAKNSRERAIKIEAWQIARFISHQLGWESYRTTTSGSPLRLVLQRVEFEGRDSADERQEVLDSIAIEESYATFIHQDVETSWYRPYYPEPQVWV